jgi:hypothetical protein
LRRKYGVSFKGIPPFIYIDRSAHGFGRGCSGMCAMSIKGMISSVTVKRGNDQ